VGLPTPWDSDDEPAIDALGPLNAQLYRAVHHHHLPHILRNFERLSMAHGVEVRMPFMDWRLVCFAFGLPDRSKIGGGFSKRIVREALRGVLPEPVRARRDKLGFSPPMGDWFRGGLGDWVWEQVQAPSFVQSTVWDGPAIRDFVGARHRAGEWRADECERVWPFVQAHLWWQTFVEHPPALRAPTPGPEGRSGPPGGPQRTGP
jgi:asparagine synthase (glutamine-hydrolysing)